MVKKEVKNSEYEVLKFLSQFLTIKEIAIQRKVSKTAVYKVIYRLEEKGYIRRIGKAIEITEDGFHRLNSFIQSSNQLRLHSLAFKLSILYKPKNWELQRNKIVSLRNLSKQIDLNNNSYEIHTFSNIKIKTTNNSIIFYMPTFYGKTTDECFKEALDTLFKSIPKIESMFKIGLIKDRKANIEIISQHYAHLQDSLAKIYKTQDKKLFIYDELGNLWLIADYSFRIDELETIYNKTAKEDMDTIANFLNDLRKNPATITNVLEMIREVTASQMIYAKNQETHIGLYKAISREIRGLSKEIKYFKNSESKKIKDNLTNGTQKSIGDFI